MKKYGQNGLSNKRNCMTYVNRRRCSIVLNDVPKSFYLTFHFALRLLASS